MNECNPAEIQQPHQQNNQAIGQSWNIYWMYCQWWIFFIYFSGSVGFEECRPRGRNTSWRQFCALFCTFFIDAAAAYSFMIMEIKYYRLLQIQYGYIYSFWSRKVELPRGGKGWRKFSLLITENNLEISSFNVILYMVCSWTELSSQYQNMEKSSYFFCLKSQNSWNKLTIYTVSVFPGHIWKTHITKMGINI